MLFTRNQNIELAAYQNPDKPLLNCVYYDHDDHKLVACDGYMIAIVPVWNDEQDESGIIPLDAIKHANKAPKKFKECSLVVSGGVVITYDNKTWNLVEGTPVNYKKAMKENGMNVGAGLAGVTACEMINLMYAVLGKGNCERSRLEKYDGFARADICTGGRNCVSAIGQWNDKSKAAYGFLMETSDVGKLRRLNVSTIEKIIHSLSDELLIAEILKQTGKLSGW